MTIFITDSLVHLPIYKTSEHSETRRSQLPDIFKVSSQKTKKQQVSMVKRLETIIPLYNKLLHYFLCLTINPQQIAAVMRLLQNSYSSVQEQSM